MNNRIIDVEKYKIIEIKNEVKNDKVRKNSYIGLKSIINKLTTYNELHMIVLSFHRKVRLLIC